jgi:hypothetical protein
VSIFRFYPSIWLVLGWVTTWEHHMLLAFHLGCEADNLHLSSAKVKEWVELYLHSPSTPSWHGAQLGGVQGQLYLYLIPAFAWRN